MTKQEFLLEATLRLIDSRQPNENASDITTLAKELTEETFKEKDSFKTKEGQFWSEETDEKPVVEIISYIEKKGYSYNSGGYAFKLTNVFKDNNIKTVGDLLRMGKQAFMKLNKVGKGSYTRVDDALEDLYNIKGW